MKYIIFDIDGVLADCSHRLHHLDTRNYKEFYSYDEVIKDDIIPEGIWMFDFIYEWIEQRKEYFNIVFLTARNDVCKKATGEWLAENIPALEGPGAYQPKLIMRPKNNWCQGYKVKEMLIEEYIGFENVLFAFDDDPNVVEMYKKHKIVCYQPNRSRNVRNGRF